jgi:cytidylate kinase
MKFTVSGWPGGGSSSLSIILCKSLGIKHMQGSEAFRYLKRELAHGETGEGRLAGHNFIEPLYGPLHDKFIDEYLQDESTDGYLIENDIASFRVGRLRDVCSIFLLTKKSERRKRMGTDNRSDDADTLEKGDEEYAKTYKELHGIEWFNEAEIREKHNTVIDNSKMSIAKTLKLVYVNLLDNFELPKEERSIVEDALAHADEEDAHFWAQGKAWYTTYLAENDLVLDGADVLRLVQERFPKEVADFPKELKTVFDAL